MSYLLDTHVALRWLTDDRKLDKEHARILDRYQRSGVFGISAFSLWEIAMVVQAGRFELSTTLQVFFADLELHTTIYPLTAAIAIESTRLGPGMHGDPADRLIVATARCHSLTLLTSDRKLIESGLVPVA